MLAALTDDQYAAPRGEWSSIGAQYRHVLEHYQCLLEGLGAGQVDYDARRRDPTIERSRERAREVTEAVMAGMAGLADWPIDHPLAVQLQCETDPTGPSWSESSLGRELQFLVSHSIHHFALIKLLLADQSDRLDPDFGTAPSTLSHSRAAR